MTPLVRQVRSLVDAQARIDAWDTYAARGRAEWYPQQNDPDSEWVEGQSGSESGSEEAAEGVQRRNRSRDRSRSRRREKRAEPEARADRTRQGVRPGETRGGVRATEPRLYSIIKVSCSCFKKSESESESGPAKRVRMK